MIATTPDIQSNSSTLKQCTRLAVVRTLYSAVVFADVAHLYFHRDLFLATGLWRRFPIGPVCIIWMIALVCLAAHFHTRTVAIVNWLCCVIMLGIVAPQDGFQQAACDSVMIGLAFLLIVLHGASPNTTRWVLGAYLSAIYLDSGIHKLLWPMWSRGYGVAVPMTLPSLVWIPTYWMALFPAWFWHLMGYGVVVFELLFALLYLIPWTRRPALLIGIAMHLGIALIYPIPAFGFVMATIYAGLLPCSWYSLDRRWLGREEDQLTFLPNASPLLLVGAAALWILGVVSVYIPQTLRVRAIHKAAWLTAGIAPHEVFAETAFANYDYQMRLVRPDGTVLPYARDNLLSIDARDRVWELWWKRTQAPPVRMIDAEAHLRAWASSARIEARPQQAVTRRIAVDLFRYNNSVVWRTIGRIENGVLHWNTPTADPQQKLGDYLDAILW